MPLYISDWDRDTRHLSCEEDGAYGRLIRHYWTNGPPQDNDTILARIVGMDRRRWVKTRTVLTQFFVLSNGVWKHNRVDAELERWAEKRNNYIERARSGGIGKAAKSNAYGVLKADDKHLSPSTVEGNPNRFPSHSESAQAEARPEGASEERSSIEGLTLAEIAARIREQTAQEQIQ